MAGGGVIDDRGAALGVERVREQGGQFVSVRTAHGGDTAQYRSRNERCPWRAAGEVCQR
jgi:hypothetical protein